KADITGVADAFDKAGELGILDSKRVVPVSAKTGLNINQLKNLLRSKLFEEPRADSSQLEPPAIEEGSGA
ncbi:MAG: GTPase HflX, partial [Nitrososphaerales archaeon]